MGTTGLPYEVHDRIVGLRAQGPSMDILPVLHGNGPPFAGVVNLRQKLAKPADKAGLAKRLVIELLHDRLLDGLPGVVVVLVEHVHDFAPGEIGNVKRSLDVEGTPPA